MNRDIYTPLQMREVFHLEFLRWFSRKLLADRYVLRLKEGHTTKPKFATTRHKASAEKV